jgi:glycosyltransferase involved in cell wall biosynthesis
MNNNVSVVIPLYNKERFIERAIRSVLSQTVLPREIIVVDDGSTDKGVEIVRQIGGARVRLVIQENSGVSVARNQGCELAVSDLVAFLDADDEWLPGFLETVLDLRERFPSAGIFSTAYYYSNTLGTITIPTFSGVPDSPEGGLIPDYFRAAMDSQPVCASAIMIPKHILREAGGFPADVRIGEDLDTWFRIALRYPVAWSPKCGAVYHLNETSVSKKGLYVGDVPFARSYEEFKKHHSMPFTHHLVVKEFIAHYRLYYNLLGTWLAGEKNTARLMLKMSKGISAFRRRWIYLRIITLVPRVITITSFMLGAMLRGEKYVSPEFYPVYRD